VADYSADESPDPEPTQLDRPGHSARADESAPAPRKLWRFVGSLPPPPGPFRRKAWRSPIRGPWLTSVFGAVLLIGLPIVILTGLLSYIAYGPQFPGNAFPAHVGYLHLPYFDWPTHPAWLYRLTQGSHVGIGLALIPIVLAKLWSVMPKLFVWPPLRSVAEALERLTVALLVGSILFEIITGVMNIQYDYVFGFSFYAAHYFGAWVFIGAFVSHVALKLPIMVRSLRGRSLRQELRTPLSATVPEVGDETGLVATDPAKPTISRRGAIAMVGGASVVVTALSVGETLGDSVRGTALLTPRGRTGGTGANHYPVNRTARTAGIKTADTGADWRLRLLGDQEVTLSRAELLAMRLYAAHLPLACVEGWSTVQTWTGVRLTDLAQLAGLKETFHVAKVTSLERAGAFRAATLTRGQILDHRSLLALRVNGADLTSDHGYPARVIVPALPGVHNTKWVASIDFRVSA
jgi:DMSO/TMAO reductase YedYZ molybdopterin-dependent catalytic subunit